MQPTFALTEQTAFLDDANFRAEKHGGGGDTRTAVDLAVTATLSNDVLSQFDPHLLASFYRLPAEGDDMLAEQEAEAGRLSKLKFPKLGATLSWDLEIEGCEVVIPFGTSNVLLDSAKVDKFRFELMEGGSVKVKFRVQGHPGKLNHDADRLTELIQQEITISVEPPEAPLLNQDKPAAQPKAKKTPKQAAAEAFGVPS